MYADYKDQTNQTLVHILGSFLRQFLTTVPVPIPVEVIKKLQNTHNLGRKLGTEDTLALLKIWLDQLKQLSQTTFICIDAVDELQPLVRQQLLDVLRELVTDYNIRLFLTGRGHIQSEVQKRFEVAQKHEMSPSQQDIRNFVRQKIKEDEHLNPEAMDDVMANDIEGAIIKKSKGM